MPGLVCSFDKHPMTKTIIDCTADDKPCKYNGIQCCRDCFDKARRDSDAAYKADCAACDACPDCQRVRRAYYEHEQRTTTIDPSQPYGQHIPLMCRNHIDADHAWHTKNIDYIGARTIFDVRGYCSCSAGDLFSPGRFIYKLCYLLGTDNCRPYGG